MSIEGKTKVVITGSNGFIGRNLATHLSFESSLDLHFVTREDSFSSIERKLEAADVVFHLAAVNRPANSDEFKQVNVQLTKFLIETLEKQHRFYTLAFSSSTQALLSNPYGESKSEAEQILLDSVSNGKCVIYRLPGVFGKWCKPNYNSVVATFCSNVANNIPIDVRDPSFVLSLVYIDDVIASLKGCLQDKLSTPGITLAEVNPVYQISLGELAAKIRSFKESRQTFFLPDIHNSLSKALYTTYLSYLPADSFSYSVDVKADNRGILFELFKTMENGQVFISKTLPGITRGNHFHHTKVEKFLVISGEAVISFRKINTNEKIDYRVSGSRPIVVDIPPGCTHNITNTGSEELITLFWANEIFDPRKPDTFAQAV